MINDSHRQFLLALATDEVRHSGRTLYEHLVGTHDLLQAWGNPAPVYTAGLFHSIYGTQRFRHRSWPVTDRATIQKLIGPEAELLVYVFCISDRPRAFFTGVTHTSNKLLRQLLEIEAANLLDQRSTSRWLRRLLTIDISAGARQAIDRYLNPNARAA